MPPSHRLAVAALLSLAAPLAHARGVTATHGLAKLSPTDPPPAGEVARLVAASNEGEGFQAVVAGGASGLDAVVATMSDLDGPTVIPASQVTLYREGYVEVTRPSDGNGRTGRLPDPLVPDVDPVVGERRNAFPFDVPPGELRVLWVDVLVPPATPAGLYRGALSVGAAGGFAEELPVELEVLPFELPSTPSYATAFGLNGYGPCRAHTGLRDCGDPGRFDELRARYAVAALDHRVSLSGVAGGGPETMVDGTGWARYDAAVGPLLDGTAATRLPGARLTSVEVAAREPSAEALAAWAAHFAERGWLDRLFDYTCDEPPLTCAWSDIAPRQAAAHAARPALRTLVTTTVEEAEAHGLVGSTDLLVPVVNFVDGRAGPYEGDRSEAYRAFAAETGGEAWIYGSCMSHGCGDAVSGPYGGDPDLAGWPSLMIDHDAVRNRAMPWVAFGRGFTGELYWDTAYALAIAADPWRETYFFSGNGDGSLFYPGTPARIGGATDVPVESMRLKHVRDGIEDHEWLVALAAAEGRAAAEAAALALFPRAFSAEALPPERLLEARRAIGRRIAARALAPRSP